jgi:hypothetical protein
MIVKKLTNQRDEYRGAAVTPADPFRAAVENRDLTALEGLFTEDVRLWSPVKFTPFEGRRMVLGLFRVLLRTFADFRYTGRLEGAARTSGGDGDMAPSAVLLFRATVNGKQIHGMDLLHFDAEGRIGELTVMVRPESAVRALREAVLAGLVADGLVPAPGPSTTVR